MQVPPKPEPKQCTQPEPFQLESLVRHEKEIQRENEERQRKEQEEAQMRIFKAQPVLEEYAAMNMTMTHFLLVLHFAFIS